MSSSDVILRWNVDCSSFRDDESASSPLENSIFPRWRMAATTLKIASCGDKRQKKISRSYIAINRWSENCKEETVNLFFFTYSNYIHSSSSSKILLCIIYTIKFVAARLVEIAKWLRIPQFKPLNILKKLIIIYHSKDSSDYRCGQLRQQPTSGGAAHRR